MPGMFISIAGTPLVDAEPGRMPTKPPPGRRAGALAIRQIADLAQLVGRIEPKA